MRTRQQRLKGVLADTIHMIKQKCPKRTIQSNLMFIIEKELPEVPQSKMFEAVDWFLDKGHKEVEKQELQSAKAAVRRVREGK